MDNGSTLYSSLFLGKELSPFNSCLVSLRCLFSYILRENALLFHFTFLELDTLLIAHCNSIACGGLSKNIFFLSLPSSLFSKPALL